MERRDQVFEVTGVPCSGKSTLVRSWLRFDGYTILLGGMPLSFGPFKRGSVSVFLSLYGLFKRSITIRQAWWLFSQAVRYDEKFFSRLNALRNSLTKFGYGYYKKKSGLILVDEGVSHIPFILGLSNESVDCFIELFRPQLEHLSIILVATPSDDTLRQRIITRGHKRVRSVKDVDSFIMKNKKIAEYYTEALLDAGLDAEIVR